MNSPYFEAVIELHTRGKARLGPFPRGAFEEHAERKKIIAAVIDGTVAGYLLYRSAKHRAAIVHLTTDVNFRNQGVARKLVKFLKEKTTHLLGISLRCRRDYNINGMWQGFNFTVRHSKEGRGADGAILDYWWFDHNHDDLFSQALLREEGADVVLTAIDANVFYDLVCDRPHSEDTSVLQADWLQDSITLCVTPELYNEIHRSSDEAEKKRCRMKAQLFHELKATDSHVQAIEKELSPLFGDANIERELSDMRQVAYAIAAEVPFFVTRDTPVLGRSDAIFEKFGLRILHPTDLVNRFDVLRREAEYRPARLEGSNWRERLVVSEDVETIVALFKHNSRERTGNFEKRVRHYLANPNAWASNVVMDADKRPVVYWVQSKNDTFRVEITMFRHVNHPLAGTLLRHLAHEISREVTEVDHKIVLVADPELSDEAMAALGELGFLPDVNFWWKISIPGLVSRESVIGIIRKADIPFALKERLVAAVLIKPDTDDEFTDGRLEKLFSPVKLGQSIVRCYVVSIRKDWAEHFFDIPVGGQLLMDLNERLHLGIEGAYYCSAHNSHVKAPGRILWYVSGKGSMCIKACSHLEEIVVGPPKEVYAKFRHLGVYAWKHVLATTHGKLDDSLMAFRFLRTERFEHPVTLAEMKRIGIPQPQNPRLIAADKFAAVYKRGMNQQ